MLAHMSYSTQSEGLALAGESKLDQQGLLDVLDLSAIANPMFKLKVKYTYL